MDLKLIRADELEQYRQNEKTILIDLRDRADYRQEHIEGAVNVPYERLERYAAGMPADTVMILYCDRGILSLKAGKKLARAGYRTAALAGGMRAYRARRS